MYTIYLGESFSITSLSAEEEGDLFGAVVNLSLVDDALGRLDGLSIVTGGPAPDENDDAADEDGDGGGEDHDELILEDDGAGAGGGGDVGRVECAFDHGGHHIQR